MLRCSDENSQAQHFQRERSRRRVKEAVFRKHEDQGQVPRPLNPRGLTSKEKAGITAGLAVSDFAFHPRDNGYAHPYCGAFSFGESAAELDSIGSLELSAWERDSASRKVTRTSRNTRTNAVALNSKIADRRVK